jgi:hypothetical protein
MTEKKFYRPVGADAPFIESDPRPLGDLKIETITEGVADAGVTIDSVLIKDGEISSQLTGLWNGLTPGLEPSTAFMFFDDFMSCAASAAPLAEWTVTEDDAADTQLIDDAAGGTLTLTCKGTTDNDSCQVQHQTEMFKPAFAKKIYFEARIKSASGDMTNSDWFIGLAASEDLTAVADNMPANGIGFHKEDAAATFSLSTSDNGTNVQSAAVGTIVDDTYIRVGFVWDGAATGSVTITPYINGVAGTAITAGTYGTMVEISPIIMVRNGDGTTTQTLVVDYFKCVQLR